MRFTLIGALVWMPLVGHAHHSYAASYILAQLEVLTMPSAEIDFNPRGVKSLGAESLPGVPNQPRQQVIRRGDVVGLCGNIIPLPVQMRAYLEKRAREVLMRSNPSRQPND